MDRKIRKLTNEVEILNYLNRERIRSAIAIGHLEPKFFQSSHWFIAEERNNFALCLLSPTSNYMLTLGDESALAFLFHSIPLPQKTFITCEPEHLEVIEDSYELEEKYIMRRMVVSQGNFSPAFGEAVKLKPAHIRELNQLYQAHGRGTFTRSQLRKGIFYGIWHDGQLVSVAGTHFISPRYGIAYIGNVLTHPLYRNQGLATICTSAVTAEVLSSCSEAVLDVEAGNFPAIQVYSKLGYKEDSLFIQARGRRKSFLSINIVYILRRFFLSRLGYEGGVS